MIDRSVMLIGLVEFISFYASDIDIFDIVLFNKLFNFCNVKRGIERFYVFCPLLDDLRKLVSGFTLPSNGRVFRW